MAESIMKKKSYEFAKQIVFCYKFLCEEKKEYTLSKQLLRSGTAIWALLREAEFAQSNSDFIHKSSIALKEANETIYRLDLLHDTNFLDELSYQEIVNPCSELVKMLVTSIKTLKSKKI